MSVRQRAQISCRQRLRRYGVIAFDNGDYGVVACDVRYGRIAVIATNANLGVARFERKGSGRIDSPAWPNGNCLVNASWRQKHLFQNPRRPRWAP